MARDRNHRDLFRDTFMEKPEEGRREMKTTLTLLAVIALLTAAIGTSIFWVPGDAGGAGRGGTAAETEAMTETAEIF